MGGIIKGNDDTYYDVNENYDGKCEKQEKLANKLLCLMITGITQPYEIPVAYYYDNSLSGEELLQITGHVLGEIEALGFLCSQDRC